MGRAALIAGATNSAPPPVGFFGYFLAQTRKYRPAGLTSEPLAEAERKTNKPPAGMPSSSFRKPNQKRTSQKTAPSLGNLRLDENGRSLKNQGAPVFSSDPITAIRHSPRETHSFPGSSAPEAVSPHWPERTGHFPLWSLAAPGSAPGGRQSGSSHCPQRRSPPP